MKAAPLVPDFDPRSFRQAYLEADDSERAPLQQAHNHQVKASQSRRDQDQPSV